MNKSGTGFWFYLEPYVHVANKGNDCLLYNTLSAEHLIYANAPEIARLLRRLRAPENMGVIRLRSSEMQNKKIAGFVEEVREFFMGDSLDMSFSRKKPLQLPGRPKVGSDIQLLEKSKDHSAGEQVLRYLTEISIYINAQCHTECPGCGEYCKQFLCCTRPVGQAKDLQPSLVFGLLDQLKGSSPARLNILGGDIFRYPGLDTLTERLKSEPYSFVFYCHYSHLAGSSARPELLDFNRAGCRVLVTPPYTQDLLRACLEKSVALRSKTKFVFVVQSAEDMHRAEHIAARHDLPSFQLKPFFNNKNLEFFREYVFLDESDILEDRPAQREIYANIILNRLNFGRLTVTNNQKVYANLNSPALGSLQKDSMHQLVYRELRNGKSWFRTRSKINPCRGCLFSALCPPPGNYEYALHRNNLCHVKNNAA